METIDIPDDFLDKRPYLAPHAQPYKFLFSESVEDAKELAFQEYLLNQ